MYFSAETPANGSSAGTQAGISRFRFEADGFADTRGAGQRGFSACKDAYPGLRRALLTGFVVGSWPILTRFRRAERHFDIVSLLGRPFNIAPNTYVSLIPLDEIFPGLRLAMDQPAWMLRDGLLSLSLWSGSDRIFSLSFILGQHEKELVAFVGGLQGRQDEGSLDLYRSLTKLAHGVRPRDLLIELFRILCEEAGVKTIFATSRKTHYQRSLYLRFIKRWGAFPLDYDSCWAERGAELQPDGLFRLKPGLHLRDPATVPAKKRAMYRNRRSLLVDLRLRLATALAFPEDLTISPHHSASGGF